MDKLSLRGNQIIFSGEVQGTIRIDQAAWEEVLDILLDNAHKYSAKGSMIRIKQSVNKGNYQLSIRDQGRGIAKKDQQIVFEKFVRLDNQEIHDVKGYGIGLGMAQSLIKKMNGHIELESESGKGSCFTVSIPAETH